MTQTTQTAQPTHSPIVDPGADPHALNAMLNLYDEDGRIQFDKDHEAVDAFLDDHVRPRMRRFASTAARLDYLIAHDYYDPAVFAAYTPAFLDEIHMRAANAGHRFETFLGAFKFYASYALKTFDGSQYLEDFPQRCAAVALELADGDEQRAI